MINNTTNQFEPGTLLCIQYKGGSIDGVVEASTSNMFMVKMPNYKYKEQLDIEEGQIPTVTAEDIIYEDTWLPNWRGNSLKEHYKFLMDNTTDTNIINEYNKKIQEIIEWEKNEKEKRKESSLIYLEQIKEFQRNCPVCNTIITYMTIENKLLAEKENKYCTNCIFNNKEK